MIAGRVRHLLLLPLVLMAAGLSACASTGVPQGYVTTPRSSTGGGSTALAPPVGTPTGEVGRVVSINEAMVQGVGGGSGNGPLVGGLLGAAGGAIIGGIVRQGGGLVGALLGAVGGAIAGVIVDRHGGGAGRGIEVVVQKDDGQKVTLAQRDDGDIQLGDRVMIVQDGQGVARAVRDNTPPSPEPTTN
jgi:outer membrane lipoprotein SlyB